MSILTKNAALAGLLETHIDELVKKERLEADVIRQAIEKGTMVLLGNPEHPDVIPTLVGQPASVKVNANIGTSPLKNDVRCEMVKLQTAINAGADTVMDLSIGGDLDKIRREMVSSTKLPLGTVPMYAVAQVYLDSDRDPADIQPDELFAEIEKQAKQGVDYMTVHCGLTMRGAKFATDGSRTMGIVSRGGSILARWMLKNDKENPLLTGYDRILEIARKYNVTLSLGDGLRPGAGTDAGDAAQWEEVMVLGQLAKRGLEAGVQCMIEGPGHVPLSEVEAQIISIKKLTNGAPLYVLGPLVIDSSPGYDHIAGAIGGAIAVKAGVDFLCYLTPAEHLTLPSIEDVHAGVIASRIAAQAAEACMGRPAAVEREIGISRARKALDWEGMKTLALDPEMVDKRREEHKDHRECAMCGKFCAYKMIEEDPQCSN
ncbi:phosphomethylpyrimidine synthase ThiC [Halodesulfovibrio sp. MK-HDV]|jgi:phosphomethylpyrimidine synthase|uniref:phosphomethylpyrimidine synthase ThiC n=1 Tax=unclassified Halodesulfovibrio TaxID=2644657 RepID=UPI0013689D52|nr:phosphomethylpyrimidine synthase ThiC [Halodesulfovibrio sp. MK-HDV]KAF1076195.1 5-hydroxybenzimidazole synthase BzaA [Halodesulfovibrio sp. MK-HDV]